MYCTNISLYLLTDFLWYHRNGVAGDGARGARWLSLCCIPQTFDNLHVQQDCAVSSAFSTRHGCVEVATRHGRQPQTSVYLCYWLELYVCRTTLVYRRKSYPGNLNKKFIHCTNSSHHRPCLSICIYCLHWLRIAQRFFSVVLFSWLNWLPLSFWFTH